MKRYTQKALRELAAGGWATDITNTHDYNAIPKPYRLVGYSKGVYGCNGKLFSDYKDQLYVVTKPTSALFMF